MAVEDGANRANERAPAIGDKDLVILPHDQAIGAKWLEGIEFRLKVIGLDGMGTGQRIQIHAEFAHQPFDDCGASTIIGVQSDAPGDRQLPRHDRVTPLRHLCQILDIACGKASDR